VGVVPIGVVLVGVVLGGVRLLLPLDNGGFSTLGSGFNI